MSTGTKIVIDRIAYDGESKKYRSTREQIERNEREKLEQRERDRRAWEQAFEHLEESDRRDVTP